MNTVVVKKENLRHNINKIKEYANKSGIDDTGKKVKIIAVVKGNAYGLGIVEYTKFLIDNGISFFAVSTIEEAIKLRKSGIQKQDILMLSSTAIEEDVKTLIENDIIITIGSKEDIDIAEKLAKKLNKKVRAHLKIDTGFGRYGFVYEKRDEIIQELKQIKKIEIEGTYSHFSTSFYDDRYTQKQFNRFINVIEVLKMNDIKIGMLHICNSSAFLKFPNMHLNAVRLGSAFTGRISFNNSIGLKKIGHMESNISEIKEVPKGFNVGYSNIYKAKRNIKIAIIPCGYMDGINIINDRDMFRNIDKLRYISRDIKDFFKKQEFYVQILDKKYKIIGRIGTYHMTCDISKGDINIGEKVIIKINPKFVNPEVRREYI